MITFNLGFPSLLTALVLSCVCRADLLSDLARQNFRIETPSTAGFQSASEAYNRRFIVKPACIAFPTNAAEVSDILKIASKYGTAVVARAGGHGYTANGLGGKDGAVVIDMSNFKQISVDSNSKIATIGTGNRLGDIALALNAGNRALPHGTCPYVGIGGHSAHGGWGFASRKWGLTLDTILSLDVVLANGTIVAASSTINSDLFWALRGAASSFGIVTAIRAQTFPAPASVTTFDYTWYISTSAAANGLLAFQTYALSSSIPADLGPEITLGRGNAPGEVYFQLTGGWYAARDKFDAAIAPLLSKLPRPAFQTVTSDTYINSAQHFGGLGRLSTVGVPDSHDTFYAKSLLTPQTSPLSTEAINAFLTYLGNQGFAASSAWFVGIGLMGGTNSVVARVPIDQTSFGHRDSLFTMQFYASDKAPFPQRTFTFLDGMVSSIVGHSPVDWDYGAYPNYIDDRLADWQKRYYGPHYARLRSLKNQENGYAGGIDNALSKNGSLCVSGADPSTQLA